MFIRAITQFIFTLPTCAEVEAFHNTMKSIYHLKVREVLASGVIVTVAIVVPPYFNFNTLSVVLALVLVKYILHSTQLFVPRVLAAIVVV